MQAVAGLLLLITGEAAPALATIAKVQGGLMGLQGSVARTDWAANLMGGLMTVAKAATLAVGIATAAVVGFGLESAHALIDSGQAAYDMSVKYGIAKDKASEWVAAGTAVGVSAGAINTGFLILSRRLETMKVQLETTGHVAKGVLQPFKDLGVNVFDAHGHLKSATEIMLELADAAHKMGPEVDQAAAFATVLGRGGAQLLPLLDEGRAGILAYMAQAKALGATLSIAQVDAAHKAFLAQQQLTLAWQGATSQLGAYFLPMLIVVINWAASVAIPALERFGKWISPFISNALTQAQGSLAQIWPWIQKFGKALADAWPWIVLIVTSLVHDFEPLFNRLGPVVATFAKWILDHLVPALASFGNWLVENGPSIRKILEKLGDDINALYQLFLQIEPWIEKVADWIGNHLNPALKFMADHLDVINPLFVIFVSTWAAWNAAMATTKAIGVLGTVVQFFRDLALAVALVRGAMAAGSLGDLSIAGIALPILGLVLAVAALLGLIIVFHDQLFGTFQGLLILSVTFWQEIQGIWFGGLIGWGTIITVLIPTMFKNAFAQWGAAFSELGLAVRTIADHIGNQFKTAFSQWGAAFSEFGLAVHTIIDHIGNAFKVAFGQWGDAFNLFGTAVHLIGLRIGARFREAFVSWGQVFSLLGTLMNHFFGAGGVIGQIFSTFGTVFHNEWSAISNTIVTDLQNIWNRIAKFDWYALGRNIIFGIINGLKSAVEALNGAAKWTAEQLLSQLRKILQLASPSRVTFVMGQNVSRGLALGIMDQSGLATGAMKNLLSPGNLNLAGGSAGTNRDLLQQIINLLQAIANDNPSLNAQSASLRLA